MDEVIKDYTESVLSRAIESNTDFSKESNIFFSEKDIYCNFYPFENDLIHYCFIIGFSGSGKTTLARKLSKKYNAKWVELDTIIYDSVNHRMTEKFIGHQKQDLLMKYLKNTKTDLTYMHDVFTNNPEGARSIIIETGRKYVEWLTTVNKEKCIISGIDLIDILPTNPKWYADPIIFKGTSRVTSMIRRTMRNMKGRKRISLTQIPLMLKWYKQDSHGIDYLRSVVITKYNSQEREEPGPLDSRSSYTRLT